MLLSAGIAPGRAVAARVGTVEAGCEVNGAPTFGADADVTADVGDRPALEPSPFRPTAPAASAPATATTATAAAT